MEADAMIRRKQFKVGELYSYSRPDGQFAILDVSDGNVIYVYRFKDGSGEFCDWKPSCSLTTDFWPYDDFTQFNDDQLWAEVVAWRLMQ